MSANQHSFFFPRLGDPRTDQFENIPMPQSAI